MACLTYFLTYFTPVTKSPYHYNSTDYRQVYTESETQILEQGVRLETQRLLGRWKTIYLGCLTGNPEIVGEIQISKLAFRMETQILIVISSPASIGQ